MRNKTKFILVILLGIVGNLACIVATMTSWILDLECKWVWLIATFGWSLFTAALGDLLRATQIINKASLEGRG